MIGLPRAVKIYLATEPADMRKGFDGLAALVEAQGLDLYSGHLFVFVSKRADRVKVLTWDRGGFVLYYKRLERGRFPSPCQPAGRQRRCGVRAARCGTARDAARWGRPAASQAK